MSMVEKVKAVKDAFFAETRDDAEYSDGFRAAIAAALDEAEKVDKALRPTTNYCEVCAKRDAAFQRAREAWLVLQPEAVDGRLASLYGITTHVSWPILDEFFGGGEGEG